MPSLPVRRTPIARAGTKRARVLLVAALGATMFAALRPHPAAAQAPEWRFERAPNDQTLRAITAVDHDHAWLVGGDGDKDCVIGRTTDGGAHWQGIFCDDGRRPESIDFADVNNGWIVGRAGQILRTTDGGRSWSAQRGGTGAAILNVFALDAQTAFAVTRDSEILVTTDGGAKWTRRTSGGDEGLFDSFWFDAQTGIAAGSAGLIMKSTDAGRKWRRIHTGSDQRFYAVTFTDARRGYTLGNDVRVTDDGGETWRLQVRPDKTMADIAFAPGQPNMGWIIGDEGLILRTTDGGQRWVNDGVGLTGKSIRGLAVVDPETIWVVGTGGLLMHRVGPRTVPTDPPPPPTSTPRPTAIPTRTPTPTPTMTPTPSGPWVRINRNDLVLMVGSYGARPLTVQYGNLGASETVSATLTGPVAFLGGQQALSAPVFPIAGAGEYAAVVQAAPGAKSGEAWSIRVRMGAAVTERAGIIAWQARLPKLNVRLR
ncbi:MAG: hypothetical protein IT332_08380 [Ardenticatenales bacterium]|nr:hypothetical protein [Ardenticatenales bacterium]